MYDVWWHIHVDGTCYDTWHTTHDAQQAHEAYAICNMCNDWYLVSVSVSGICIQRTTVRQDDNKQVIIYYTVCCMKNENKSCLSNYLFYILCRRSRGPSVLSIVTSLTQRVSDSSYGLSAAESPSVPLGQVWGYWKIGEVRASCAHLFNLLVWSKLNG